MTDRYSTTDKYAEVADAILASLETGTAPWRKPWRAIDGGAPRNAFSKRPYRGINVWLLLATPYSDPRWGTFNQIRNAGGMVRKGERGSRIYFFKPLTVADRREGREGRTRTIPLLNSFTVFNIEQADGLKLPVLAPVEVRDPIEAADAIVEGMPKRPAIAQDGRGKAYYQPSTDDIHMPARGTFTSDEGWYETLFHELGHSTGHESRVGRDTLPAMSHFGDGAYGREELVAEMTAGFLMAEAGIAQGAIENIAAYVKHWMNAIHEDKRMVVVAAGQAQKAADFILDRKPEVDPA